MRGGTWPHRSQSIVHDHCRASRCLSQDEASSAWLHERHEADCRKTQRRLSLPHRAMSTLSKDVAVGVRSSAVRMNGCPKGRERRCAALAERFICCVLRDRGGARFPRVTNVPLSQDGVPSVTPPARRPSHCRKTRRSLSSLHRAKKVMVRT